MARISWTPNPSGMRQGENSSRYCWFSRTVAATSPMPPNTPKMTNRPMARKARSLTRDSSAMAHISPRWCSLASMVRVPNSIENSARARATYSDSSDSWADDCETTSNPVVMPFSCSAMYGTEPITAATVTSTAMA